MIKYYIDSDVGRYKKIFPLVKYSFPINLGRKESIEKSLKGNIWFKNSISQQKVFMIQKIQSHNRLIEKLLKIIQKRTRLKVCHISVGGSYLFNNCEDTYKGPQDIDYNVLVSGSYFDYFNFYRIKFLKNTVAAGRNIKKISFMIFGEDNIFKGTTVNDSIESEGYVHTDMAIREGLIFGWRNGTIYGNSFGHLKMNEYNLLVRVARQLYQAKLFLQNKIGIKRTMQQRRKKALNRIIEAIILLAEAFHNVDISIKDEYCFTTKTFNEELVDLKNIWFLYEKVVDYYDKARRTIELAERPSLPKTLITNNYQK